MAETKKTALDIILGNLDNIHKWLLECNSYPEIANKLTIGYRLMYNYINYSNMLVENNTIGIHKAYSEQFIKDNFSKITMDVALQITRACDIESEMLGNIENALYKSCFDHTIKYTEDIVDNDGQEHHLVKFKPIQASYNAQRYVLINKCRHTGKYTNENAPIEIKADNGEVQKVQVLFVDPKDQSSMKRVGEIQKKVASYTNDRNNDNNKD